VQLVYRIHHPSIITIGYIYHESRVCFLVNRIDCLNILHNNLPTEKALESWLSSHSEVSTKAFRPGAVSKYPPGPPGESDLNVTLPLEISH
jgi:hypothetical protein